MRLLTSLPAILGRISDLVDRDVTSDLTVEQTSLMQLPPIPFPYRAFSAQNPIETTHALGFNFTQAASSAAGLNNGAALAKGLWHLEFSINFRVNFVRDSAQFVISLTPNTFLDGVHEIYALGAGSVNGYVVDSFDMWVLLEDNSNHIQYSVPSTGVGEGYGVAVVNRNTRYL